MATSTNLISGLSSGFDWRSMIDQLIAIEHESVDLVEAKKSDYEAQLAEWQSFNTKLLALKTASGGLRAPEDFYVYTTNMTSNSSTVEASDLLSVSTTALASKGSYSITDITLATAEKLSSASFASFSDALGSSYAGDILINGTTITVSASDGLDDVRDKINNANSGTNPTGVTASIVTYGTNNDRLVLTSDATGEDGISLQNGSSIDLVQLFGWKDYSTSVKNSITDGAQSDSFSSSTAELKTLLGLSTTQSGTIQVDGNNVDIDLSADTLEEIKTKIDAVSGVSASIVTTTSGSTTTYKLQIDGTQSFADSQNILETLGILKNGVAAIQGTISGNSMTSDGANITASTLITDIDGYHTFTAGDKISLGASSRDHGNNDISGDILTITTSSSFQDLLDAIETAYQSGANDYKVAARVTSDGKIEITDLETETSNIVADLQSTIADSPNSALDWGSFTARAEVRERQISEGQDASLKVDGVTATSSDNTVDDVITGVTLNLLKTDASTTVTLNIDRDVDAIMEKITSFVDAYNEVFAYIYQQQSYDEEEEGAGGVLFGDGTLSSVKSDLSNTLLEAVWGVDDDFSSLTLIGIELGNVTSGQSYEPNLTIDTDTLKGYLQTNFNDVMNLFVVNGTISGAGTLEYVASNKDTQAGTVTVNITAAATQSNSTSDTAVGGTLGGNETLAITEGNSSATISLTSSMTISDIINAVNSELDTVYTEKHVGDQALTAGGSPITSATTWESILGTAFVNGDVISFSGTTPEGTAASGEYTISDKASGTVQGFLSSIDTAYGNDVIASIDTSGRLVITDKHQGNSALTIEITEPAGRGLDFGTVDVTAGAGDGSQEGRYAMAITASNDGSNHLKLTHDSYGDKEFAISETGDILWVAGDQTVNNGVNVAGTIKGEAATGSGQTLTGNDGEANVDGLVIKYTGTTTGDIGTVTVTLGVAELFDRILYSITDSYEGYVGFKQDSLEEKIDSISTNIEAMEVRLERKLENMINRFVAMEMALAAMQSQSQWLNGQINASYSGWG
jgi:flagellar hook-associated protein 2